MKEEKNLNIYNEEIEQLCKRLQTSENGLSEQEALNRLQANGENKLEERKKKSNFLMFLNQ